MPRWCSNYHLILITLYIPNFLPWTVYKSYPSSNNPEGVNSLKLDLPYPKKADRLLGCSRGRILWFPVQYLWLWFSSLIAIIDYGLQLSFGYPMVVKYIFMIPPDMPQNLGIFVFFAFINLFAPHKHFHKHIFLFYHRPSSIVTNMHLNFHLPLCHYPTRLLTPRHATPRYATPRHYLTRFTHRINVEWSNEAFFSVRSRLEKQWPRFRPRI